jgi:hypothetical protein
VQNFLETYFPIDTPEIMAKYRCKLRVDITADGRQGNPVINMQWLLTFPIDCSDVEVTFDGRTFDWEAEDLGKLLDIARSSPAWRERIAGFHIIKLPTKTQWHPGCINNVDRRKIPRPNLVLKFVFKPEDVAAWWDDKDQRFEESRKMLQELGLREEITPDYETNPFRGLKIGVYKKGKYFHEESWSRIGYW